MLKIFMKLIIFLTFFTSCSLEPPYERVDLPVPDAWKAGENNLALDTRILDYWWEVFQDPLLDCLESQALQYNYNLDIAVENIIQAKSLAEIALASLYPQLYLLPQYNSQGYLFQSQNRVNLPPDAKVFRVHTIQDFLPLNLSYELDFWGKLRNQYKAAYFAAEAQVDEYHTALLIVTTDLASAYFQLRVQDNLIDLLEATIKTRQKAYDINKSRYEGKLTNYSDVAVAELDLRNAESQYFEAIRVRQLYENEIAVYVGMPASDFKIQHHPLNALPPPIPVGLPSDVLLQRPDLAAQEWMMVGLHAQIGVAYASFFPSIELIGNLGYLSPITSAFLKNKSRYWSIGSNISQLVFDAGATYNNLQISWSEYRQAVDNYKQMVLVAFQEVENALSNIEWLDKELTSVKGAINAANKAYVISFDRYKQGVTFYLEVADNERQELLNQQAYASLLALRYVNTIQLIKALGGAWNNQEVYESCGS